MHHKSGEYVRGKIHTNTVEGFFGQLKRSINGTHHSISHRHLHRYLAEFDWRYNTRRMTDGARTLATIKAGEGKRLRYSEPT